jgi:FAD/FMN-containing dehydrogenase
MASTDVQIQPASAWTTQLTDLAAQISGLVLNESDDGYRAEHAGFDLSVRHRPALVVGTASTGDIVSAVRFARSHRLPVGVHATGHGPTAAADGGLLISTRRACAVEVDPVSRTARLQAGTTWAQVIEAAAPFGLAPLAGAAPSVGAVSYTLGGGLSPLGRRYGFAADHVRAIEVVTADGELRRVTAETHRDLFWAMRGAGSNFGVVTSLEIDLMTVPDLYGGGLFFPGEARSAVLAAFARCALAAPDSLSLSVAVLTFPDAPVLPSALRGRHCCHVRVTHQGPGEQAETLIRVIRDAGPVLLDTIRPLPLTEIGTIHNDPTTPNDAPGRSLVLRSLDHGLIDTVTAHTGPGTPSMVELRHMSGALGRSPRIPNAVGHRGGVLNLFTIAYPAGDYAPANTRQQRLLADLQPWSDSGALVTFLAGPEVTPADVRAAYRPQDYERLAELKTRWDPSNMFRFNKNIPPNLWEA